VFRGLYVGIDRYSPPVPRLSCARADAVGLAALFEDTLGGHVLTLLDQDATLERLGSELVDLSKAAEDDFVVISFSGHGTEDHRLVPVDVDVTDLPDSCMSLDEFAELLDAIPARQLIVFLDCCFSGGFGGARVFAPYQRRDMVEDRSVLNRMVRGDGRVVITASGAGEPALETQEFGHGLLTYSLLNGLQGPGDIIENQTLPLLRLFDYVLTHVVDAASRLGEKQTPTLYGSVEGVPALSPLSPGAHFAAAFPSRVRQPIDDTWESLAAYGIPDDILKAWFASMSGGPNSLQRRAVNEFSVLDGRSVLVVAPTGSGKTMIGEMAAVQQAVGGARAVMLLPLRALVNDKYAYFKSTYGDQFKVIRATGEHSDEITDLYAGQYDLALLTYEKFLSIVIGSPFLMRGISLVVVDEAQNISDPSRGASLEFLLTLIRSGHARGGAPQVIALSAVIGASNGLERWLGAELLQSTERPVPLRETVLDARGDAQHRHADGTETRESQFVTRESVAGSQGSKPIVLPLLRLLIGQKKKVIVFRATRGEAQGTASYLAQALGLRPAQSVLDRLPGGDPAASSQALRAVLAGGVAFHTSDLDRDERAAIEEIFRDPESDLRVIAATTTLAMGVNTPAEAVVIVGLRHPFADNYLVSEYKNMAGRAGRPGYATTGEAYIIASDSPSPPEAWNRYVLGNPEDIVSHFLSPDTDPQTLILRSLAALGSSVEESELIDLLDNSYAIWGLRDQGRVEGWDLDSLRRDIEALVAGELLDREPSGLLTLTDLGRFAAESGLEVRSVTQVSSALRFVPQILAVPDLITLAQVTAEADAVYLPIHKRSRQEQSRWPATLVQDGASPNLVHGLHVGGGETLPRAKRAVACLYYMSRSPLSVIEQELTQHMRDGSIAGPVRGVSARTRDVIGAVGKIAEFRGYEIEPTVSLDDLLLRLELGLPQESVQLARVLGNFLSRGEYLRLLSRGVVSSDQLKNASADEFRELFGEARGQDVARELNLRLSPDSSRPVGDTITQPAVRT
jgi:helicase